jgi:hypothetical protein
MPVTDFLTVALAVTGVDRYANRMRQAQFAMNSFRQDMEKTRKAGSHIGIPGVGMAVLSGAVGGAAYMAGSAAAKATVEFERLNARMLTMTKGDQGGANAMMRWAVDFAKRTPYEINEVTDAMIHLRNMGIEPTKGALKTIGDFGAAWGRDMFWTVDAVTDALMGNWMQMRRYGLKREIMEQWMTKRGMPSAFNKQGEVTDREGLRRALFMYMSEQGSGGMGRMMDTVQGKWSNMKDAAWRANVAMGTALSGGVMRILTHVEKGLDRLADFMTRNAKLISTVFNGMITGGEMAYSVFMKIWPVLKPIIGYFLLIKGFKFGGALWEWLHTGNSSIRRFRTGIAVLIPYLRALTFADVARRVMWFALQFKMSATMIGLSVGRVGTAVKLLTWAKLLDIIKHLPGIRSVIAVFGGLYKAIMAVVTALRALSWAQVIAGVTSWFNAVISFGSKGIQAIGRIIKAIRAWIVALKALSAAEAMAAIMHAIADAIKTKGASIAVTVASITAVIAAFWGALKGIGYMGDQFRKMFEIPKGLAGEIPLLEQDGQKLIDILNGLAVAGVGASASLSESFAAMVSDVRGMSERANIPQKSRDAMLALEVMQLQKAATGYKALADGLKGASDAESIQKRIEYLQKAWDIRKRIVDLAYKENDIDRQRREVLGGGSLAQAGVKQWEVWRKIRGGLARSVESPRFKVQVDVKGEGGLDGFVRQIAEQILSQGLEWVSKTGQREFGRQQWSME